MNGVRVTASNLLATAQTKPSLAAAVAGKLAALAVDAGIRRARARWQWSHGPQRLRYAWATWAHPAHVRAGLPAESVGCFCDRRGRMDARTRHPSMIRRAS